MPSGITYLSRDRLTDAQQFPVIDVDIQQPVYFNPNPTPPFSSTPASKPDNEMDAQQKARVSKLEGLAQAYTETLNKCRTLDGYVHEFIDETDMNFRNGDQVVSRFVERIRCPTWRHKRPSGQLVPAVEEPAKGAGVRRRARRNSIGTRYYGKPDTRLFKASNSGTPNVFDYLVAEAETPGKKSTSATPSQLESQNHAASGPRLTQGFVSRIWQDLRNSWAGHVLPKPGQVAPTKEHLVDTRIQKESKDDESIDSDNDRVNELKLDDKRVLQQILTVPQIWLWAVEGQSTSTGNTRREFMN